MYRGMISTMNKPEFVNANVSRGNSGNQEHKDRNDEDQRPQVPSIWYHITFI